MESELRIVLIVLGVLAILALVVHGLYTTRKNKQIRNEQYAPDQHGGDENDDNTLDDGVVSPARVVSSNNPTQNTQSSASVKPQPKQPAEKPAPKTFSEKLQSIRTVEKPKEKAERIEPDLGGEQLQMSLTQDVEDDNHDFGDDLFDQISARESADSNETLQPEENGQPNASKEQAAQAQKQAEPEEVLILNVVAPEGQSMSGAVLLPSLLTLGFKFGEFNIFHRHEEASGTGEVLFSLANMFNPGTFDIDNIEQFTTQGVSLFLSLPVKGDAQQAFNMMHNAAKKIAAEFSGQVLDGQRSVLTRQTVQHYVERIREFERRQLLKS
ncbi:cell division protein ZipA [Catenovulum agarivorans DS-2]|uniref:Cell division protein ZipA n=1 Tax=Catenovulum agarivorans DS-2 TaxID=1328313 RepID=W7Q7V3_9ALTE|nr:cell division protein ZipA [Catenovulum agarivorans]EWH08879.1 cell division protein ZipA [Catenovulum agarivorans DS-2]